MSLNYETVLEVSSPEVRGRYGVMAARRSVMPNRPHDYIRGICVDHARALKSWDFIWWRREPGDKLDPYARVNANVIEWLTVYAPSWASGVDVDDQSLVLSLYFHEEVERTAYLMKFSR